MAICETELIKRLEQNIREGIGDEGLAVITHHYPFLKE